MAYLKGVNFDDSPVRCFLIGFFKDKFNLLLGETPQEKKLIDLTGITETHIGVEGECGKWSGNFWENDSYSLISGLEFRTVNIPIRKEKHWQEYPIRWKKVKHNPSFKHNIFARTNKDFTQVIIIRPETIRDPEKVLRTEFQPNNSDKVEKWLSFRREHVETYNLINDTWVLDKQHEI